MKKLPSTRWFVCCKQAVKEIGLETGLPLNYTQEIIDVLERLKLHDEEWIEYINNNHDEHKAIFKRIAKLIKEKNKKEQKIIQEIEKKREEEIKKNVEKQVMENFEAGNNLVQDALLMKNPNKATELMAQHFLKKEHIYSTRDDLKSEMWIYKDGIYVPQAKSYIKEYVRKCCGQGFTTHLCNNVINKIEAETFIEQDKFFVVQNPQLVAIQNGILNVVTRELVNFSPDMFFFNKLPVTYDLNAKCDNIKGFFKSILHEGDEVVMQELFGYLLLRDYKFEKAFMFAGGGRNGKGKCVELMKRFIGVENCANISLQRIETDTFAMCELFMKMANLSADISSTALKETGNFKTLTGHDMVTANRKYLQPISFTNFAKMIFCANELPRTSDTTTAFFNRWILIDFPYTFYSEKEIEKLDDEQSGWVRVADQEIIKKISTQEELNGLLLWALDGLERLITNKDFSYSKGTDDVKREWLRKCDSFTAFCMDCLEENYDGEIQKNELRRVYVHYCRSKKLKPVSDKLIRDNIFKMFPCWDSRRLLDDERVLFWNGISFKKSYDDSFLPEKSSKVDAVD